MRDYYWPLPIKSDLNRLQKQMRRKYKNHIKKFHPEWFYDLIECGLPTYYFILSVKLQFSKYNLEKNLELKLAHSSFDAETILYAYRVLSDRSMRLLYNQFLRLSPLYFNTLEPAKIKKLEATHLRYVRKEQEYMLFSYLIREHLGWHIMELIGFPDFYNLAGFQKKIKREKILENYISYSTESNSNNELLKVLCEILLVPQLHKEYRLMRSFQKKYLKTNVKRIIKKRRKIWKKWGFTRDDIIKNFLYGSDLTENLQKWEEYYFENIDWQEFLPPSRSNFYTLLGLFPNTAANDPKRFRKHLFEQYKSSKRTPEVNLAYSILKDPASKKIYDWLLSNEVYMKVHFILTLEEEELNHLLHDQQKKQELPFFFPNERPKSLLASLLYDIFS
ncbi:MAG: hypothetical protein ACTSRS_06290 [Candidatus Helarchaeota archaeon]